MKERPILFSGPMVRAIMEGKKSQTRRTVKPNLAPVGEAFARDHLPKLCPYGVSGDRLWVRETFCTCYDGQEAYEVIYAADNTRRGFSTASNATDDQLDWLERSMTTHGERGRPAIHMPRWACRLVLEIASVRVERLQAITGKDIIAEGAVERAHDDQFGHNPVSAFDGICYLDLKSLWAAGWDSINGKRAPWTSNPWVWVVEFKRAEYVQQRFTK